MSHRWKTIGNGWTECVRCGVQAGDRAAQGYAGPCTEGIAVSMKPRSAAAIVARRGVGSWTETELLVVRNIKRGGWVFPGGKLEPGELPSDAMVRGLKEEAGLDALGWRLLYEGIGDDIDRVVTIFEVTDFVGGLSAESPDHPEPRWETMGWILNNTCFPEFYERVARELRREGR